MHLFVISVLALLSLSYSGAETLEGFFIEPENPLKTWVAGSTIHFRDVQNASTTTGDVYWTISPGGVGPLIPVMRAQASSSDCRIEILPSEYAAMICESNCTVGEYFVSQLSFCDLQKSLDESKLVTAEHIGNTHEYRFDVSENCNHTTNAQVTITGSGIDGKAEFYCPPGQKLVGEADATCQYNTSWTSEPMCEECSGDAYGMECQETCKCSSNKTLCHPSLGCQCDIADPTFACDMNTLTIDAGGNYSAILGYNKAIRMVLRVNALRNDIDISVTPPELATFNGTVEPGDDPFEYVYEVPVDETSEGEYIFTVRSQSYPDIFNISIANVEPIIKPVTIEPQWEPNSNGYVIETAGRKNYSVDCSASGDPPMQVTWKLPGSATPVSDLVIPTRIYQEIIDNATTRLHIRPSSGLQASDSGSYVCVASSIVAGGVETTDYATFALLVKDGQTEEVEYASQKNFLIGVCVVGIFLFLLWVAIIVCWIILCRSGSSSSCCKKKKAPRNFSAMRRYSVPVPGDEDDENIYESVKR